MKILITSGITPGEVGGPGQYGPELAREFARSGHRAKLKGYTLEHRLPIGLRHFYFLLKIIPRAVWADVIITLDTFSVGLPSVLIGRLLYKQTIVRVGGDFLWETYVRRTGEMITLRTFNERMPALSVKEKIIYRLTRWLCSEADILAFNTEWQKEIWMRSYPIEEHKTKIMRNFIPPKAQSSMPAEKLFIWAGRKTIFKNIEALIRASSKIDEPDFRLELITDMSHEEVLKKLSGCYAVALPSLSDVCPNFILEAISFNKPFVMTRETGIQEICNSGGYFVDPLNEQEIENGIRQLLDENIYQRKLAELQSATNERSWSDIAYDFESLLGADV